VIHLYGVVDGLDELPAGLERRRLDGLELVFAHEPTPPSPEVSREAVLRHAQVVEELAGRSSAILPAQLGRAFRDEAELAEAVREQAPQLSRALQRVRGCVEFGVRAVADEQPPEADAASGADYMRARLEEVRRQDALVAQVHEPLDRLARASTLHRGHGEVRAAYLVARDDVARFEDAAAQLERTPGATVVCTGPWAPYSFAGERPS
jgi:hypothetical protein